jgi:hypothetical protein
MKVSTATFVFLLLLVAIAVAGHSVWHAPVLRVMHFLTDVFTGTR